MNRINTRLRKQLKLPKIHHVKPKSQKTIEPSTLALRQQTAFSFRMLNRILCVRNGSKRKEHLRRSGPNSNHDNGSRQLHSLLNCASFGPRGQSIQVDLYPFSSYGRHARKRRLQSRDKEVFQMQIGGALFLSKVYSREQMFI